MGDGDVKISDYRVWTEREKDEERVGREKSLREMRV
jgi:hypothetical protein